MVLPAVMLAGGLPLGAHAGPPLISDDPNTIGAGNVEAIVAIRAAGELGADLVEAPLFDITVGVDEGLDLTFVAGPAFLFEETFDQADVAGEISVGAKWRFLCLGDVTAALTPAVGADVLSTQEFFIAIPAQIEFARGRFAIGADGGYTVVPNDADGWSAFLYSTYEARRRLLLMAELWAISPTIARGTLFGTGVGADWQMLDQLALLGGISTGLASTRGPRVEWGAFLGVRWSFRAFGSDDAANARARSAPPGLDARSDPLLARAPR